MATDNLETLTLEFENARAVQALYGGDDKLFASWKRRLTCGLPLAKAGCASRGRKMAFRARARFSSN